MGLEKEWTCAIDVVTLFLMLASKITMTVLGSNNALIIISLSLLQ